MALTQQGILAGLRALGVKPGMVVMAHSALSSFGEVAGGADAVIEALIEAVGPQGTLLMPAMASVPVFDVSVAKSNVGIVTDTFWRRPGVIRSIHPTHSAAGIGPMAQQLLAGHVSQPTALGPESPWGRIARLPDGYILLLGCDQDRNTLLHCAEEAVDAPYLTPLQREYLDENREKRSITLNKFPGPHRDFIGLDHVFRERGVMRTGKIGKAACRLMHAAGTLEAAIEALRRDPAAVLCDNPHCDDCVMQRGRIKRARLAEESFTLCACFDDVAQGLADTRPGAAFLTRLGIRDIEVGDQLAPRLWGESVENRSRFARELHSEGLRVHTLSAAPMVWEALAGAPTDWASFAASLELAQELGARYIKLPPIATPPGASVEEAAAGLKAYAVEAGQRGLELLVENGAGTAWATKDRCEALLALCEAPNVRLGFNPAEFARAGEHPFLRTYYKGNLKKHLAVLYIEDGCPGPEPPRTLPGRGKGEVKELMSILRCRSFDGIFCLRAIRGAAYSWSAMQETWDAFWHLMDTL